MSIRSKRSWTRRRRNSSGFTLLESMIALGILAFGILSVAGALITSIRFSRQSRSQTQAMVLAERQVEMFQSMPAADVLATVDNNGVGGDANPIDPTPGDEDVRTFTRSWTITDASPEVGVMSIEVEVDWMDENNEARVVLLETMKANR